MLSLYIDDTGSRFPDRESVPRKDGMDCFGLGGIIVRDEDTQAVLTAYSKFKASIGFNCPLHSTKIRGKRGSFAWLGDKDKAAEFHEKLEAFLLGIQVIGIAAVVDRNGYNDRYKVRYEGKPWLMCKTAYSILIERAVKYAQSQNRKLKLYFEESGKDADRSVLEYTRSLKVDGMPFKLEAGAKYAAVTNDQFRKVIVGEPQRQTKQSVMMQVADLYLYPMAKAGYEKDYPPYQRLVSAARIIDAVISPEQVATHGVKYSCFDQVPPKNK